MFNGAFSPTLLRSYLADPVSAMRLTNRSDRIELEDRKQLVAPLIEGRLELIPIGSHLLNVDLAPRFVETPIGSLVHVKQHRRERVSDGSRNMSIQIKRANDFARYTRRVELLENWFRNCLEAYNSLANKLRFNWATNGNVQKWVGGTIVRHRASWVYPNQ